MSCKTCQFFQDCECRRHAPHILLLRENRVTVWPLVTPDKWCGDYAAKETPSYVHVEFGLKPDGQLGVIDAPSSTQS